MRSLSKMSCFAVLGLFALPGLMFAQGQRGAITGTVMDPSGAVVPDASITITEKTTNVASTAKSSSAGYYRVPVPPGTYRVEARKEGFKAVLADNIIVDVASVVTVDLTLQVGNITEEVTVTTEAPLLESSTPEVGNSITAREFETLPILVDDGGRQLQTFIFTSLPGTVGDAFAGSINGGQLFSSEILIDGVSIARYDLSGGSLVEFSPSTDAIGEFKVQMSNYSAEYGETGGGIANFSMKSGTNSFHGTLYEYFKNPVLNAAGFDTNSFGGKKANTERENNFGGTFGGPIKRDRTFFFFAYEGYRFRNFRFSSPITMPTPAMLKGDFSAWLGSQIGTDDLGRPVYENEIYDPTTTRTLPDGTIIRDPVAFNGQLNMIDPNEFSKGSAVLLPLFPSQYLNSNLIRNYPSFSGCCPILNSDKESIKIDHVINTQNKLTGSFNWHLRKRYNRDARSFPPFPGYPLNPVKQQIVGGPQVRLSEVWTVNDHTINSAAIGFNRFGNANGITPNAGWPSKLGITGVQNDCFPPIRFRGHVGQLGRLGAGCPGFDPSESYIFSDTLSYLRGKHGLKFGAEFRRYRYNVGEIGQVSGSFAFSDRETALPGFTGDTGHPFASFVLGAVDSGGRAVSTTLPGYRAGFLAFYAQDDWKTTPKLTISYGLRWEIPLPKKEAFNRMSGLDPTAANTSNDPNITDANGIPGALVFLGSCQGCNGRHSFQDVYYKEFGPRLGVAYAASNKLVLRGGYGISYGPPILNNFGSQNIFGFNGGVNLARGTSPTNFKLDPVIYWTPLTNALLPPAAQVGVPPFNGSLPTRNPAIANGNGIDFLPRKSLAQPYVQSWSAGLQYQLPKEILFEANYVGSKGTRLLSSIFSNMNNQVPTRYIGLGDLLGDDLQTDLSDPTNGPILASYGITQLPYANFENDFNPTVAQSLRPFSQYDVITNNYPELGSSTYHSLQMKAQKRAAHGLNFIAAYTYSKTLTNSDTALYYPTGGFGVFNFGQDFYNRRGEKSLAAFDYTHFLKITSIYELPFGHGKKWLSSTGALDRLVSGWTITAIQNYRSGDALSILSSDLCTGLYSGAYGDGCSVRVDILTGVPQTVPLRGLDAQNGTPYLNPSAFAKPPLTPNNGFAAHFGSAPRFLPNVRGPGWGGEDIGLVKDTRINERFSLLFRADAFNTFNRTGRGDPDTDLADDIPANGGTFGLITGAGHGARVIQLSMRLNF